MSNFPKNDPETLSGARTGEFRAAAPLEDWTGQILAGGRYRVEKKLGEGGMGIVYLAQDENLQTPVVVKVPHPQMLSDAGFVERFGREVRSLVRLRGPRICRITDAGEHGSVPYLVLEYLEGGSLEDRALPMALKEILRWLPGLAEALDFVGKMNVVHRDVKPSNILFDTHGNVYLSDFGIAKALEEEQRADEEEQRAHGASLTGVGHVVGTAEYMAPEVCMGREYKGRADQYSLGVVLYELVSGRLPFEGRNRFSTMAQHEYEAAPPLDGSVPRGVSEAIMKALSKKPEQRFETSGEFARAVAAGCVEKARATAPVTPPATPPVREERRPARKRSTGGVEVYQGWPFDGQEAASRQRETAERLGLPVEHTNSLGMKLRLIPAGEFLMGSPEAEAERDGDEKQHRVRITKAYYLGAYEVTQAEYEGVMGENPSNFKGGTLPVENVSCVQAMEFCRRLSKLEGKMYRLPTEAEWEYACRAGTPTPFAFGETLSSKTDGNFDGKWTYGGSGKGPYLKRTAPVGSYRPNAWGLYDMHGNVWEWCGDLYETDYYEKSPLDDPMGPTSGANRVIRGGGWGRPPRCCRSANRYGGTRLDRTDDLGFRVVQVPAE